MRFTILLTLILVNLSSSDAFSESNLEALRSKDLPFLFQGLKYVMFKKYSIETIDEWAKGIVPISEKYMGNIPKNLQDHIDLEMAQIRLNLESMENILKLAFKEISVQDEVGKECKKNYTQNLDALQQAQYSLREYYFLPDKLNKKHKTKLYLLSAYFSNLVQKIQSDSELIYFILNQKILTSCTPNKYKNYLIHISKSLVKGIDQMIDVYYGQPSIYQAHELSENLTKTDLQIHSAWNQFKTYGLKISGNLAMWTVGFELVGFSFKLLLNSGAILKYGSQILKISQGALEAKNIRLSKLLTWAVFAPPILQSANEQAHQYLDEKTEIEIRESIFNFGNNLSQLVIHFDHLPPESELQNLLWDFEDQRIDSLFKRKKQFEKIFPNQKPNEVTFESKKEKIDKLTRQSQEIIQVLNEKTEEILSQNR